MKLNRKWLLLVALVLSVAMATTGTLAYLTDEDADVNTMTLGKVEIVQNEQERTEHGLDEFTQDKPLYPAVFPGSSIPWAAEGDWVEPGNQAWKVVEDNSNVVDKFVTVTNIGKSDAYVRTIIAYEGDETYGPEGEYIHIVHNSDNVTPAIEVECLGVMEINEVKYTVYSYTYPEVLTPDQTTIPSLKQIYMDKNADNEVVEQYGEKYDVLVLSQAIQVNGFEEMGPADALNEGFGEVNATNLAKWLAETEVGSPGDKWPNNNPPSRLAKVTEISADRTLVKTKDDGTTVNIVNPGRKIALDDYGVMTDSGEVALDVAYQFQPAITAEEVKNNEYRYWHADFVVKADKDIPSYGIGLAGYYSLFGELITDEKWVMLAVNEEIPAGQEIRLVLDGLEVTLNFEEICNYGNDGIGFLCGAVALNGELNGAEELTPGTELTVELRLYETEEPSAENGNSHNVETGEYMTVGEFTYTFN